jgi:ribosomal protein S6
MLPRGNTFLKAVTSVQKNKSSNMNNNTNIKLQDALQDAEAYIAQMKNMEDKKLARHINLFRKQMAIAYQQGNTKAFELLSEYEQQTIVARAGKIGAKVIRGDSF